MEWVLGLIGGVAGLGVILNKLLKKLLPPEKLDRWDKAVVSFSHAKVQKAGFISGRTLSLNITKWPVIGPLYELVIEPWIIVFSRLLGKYAAQIIKDFIAVGFPNGLLSDNNQPKPEE